MSSSSCGPASISISGTLSKPNVAHSLNNDFVAQTGTVEVVKDWQIKYEATVQNDPGGTTIQWQRKREGEEEWDDFAVGASVVHDEANMGNYEVRVQLKDETVLATSGMRNVKVVAIDSLPIDVDIPPNYNYTKSSGNSSLVLNPADPFFLSSYVYREANPNNATGITKIKHGVAQGISGTKRVAFAPNGIGTWAAGSPGDVVQYSQFLQKNYPNQAFVRDGAADSGWALYGSSEPEVLEVPTAEGEHPKVESLQREIWVEENPLRVLRVSYWPNSDIPTLYQFDFVTWDVVLNTETKQYVPLSQQKWEIKIDTSQAGPWTATKVGGVTAPDTNLPAESPVIEVNEVNVKSAPIPSPANPNVPPSYP